MNPRLEDGITSKERECHFPPDDDWLSLTQALSWIAFEDCVEADAVGSAPEGTIYFRTYTLDAALAHLVAVGEKLMQKAASGQVSVFGRYLANENSHPESVLRELTNAECLSFTKYSPYEFVVDKLEFDCLVLASQDTGKPGFSSYPYFVDVKVGHQQLKGLDFWPREDADVLSPEGYHYRTGLPGRPSMMNLVLQEFERRWDSGEYAGNQRAEAIALEEWARQNHPAAPQIPTAGTIRNAIAPHIRTKRA